MTSSQPQLIIDKSKYFPIFYPIFQPIIRIDIKLTMLPVITLLRYTYIIIKVN